MTMSAVWSGLYFLLVWLVTELGGLPEMAGSIRGNLQRVAQARTLATSSRLTTSHASASPTSAAHNLTASCTKAHMRVTLSRSLTGSGCGVTSQCSKSEPGGCRVTLCAVATWIVVVAPSCGDLLSAEMRLWPMRRKG